jgi:hypothetical protein
MQAVQTSASKHVGQFLLLAIHWALQRVWNSWRPHPFLIGCPSWSSKWQMSQSYIRLTTTCATWGITAAGWFATACAGAWGAMVTGCGATTWVGAWGATAASCGAAGAILSCGSVC